jgi:hypothetical protein
LCEYFGRSEDIWGQICWRKKPINTKGVLDEWIFQNAEDKQLVPERGFLGGI